jgi:hypothetical protein
MTGVTGIGFAPLMPWPAIVAVAVLALVLLVFAAIRGARGSIIRAFAIAILAAALFNPHLESETRRGEPDIALLVLDESSSQNTGERRQQLAQAADAVREKLGKFEDLQVRVVRGKETKDGTLLFDEFDRALADLPKGRFAGSVFITDGQVHDVPKVAGGQSQAKGDSKAQTKGQDVPAAILPDGPVHTLLTGTPNERDRRLTVERAPAFGLVGKSVQVRIKVEDRPDRTQNTAPMTVRIDGGTPFQRNVRVGAESDIEIPIEHGGATIVELEVQGLPNELSLANNRAVLSVNGVRDRLKVLLVSGQPHLGERTWRNLLKSDPSVDLVHFTILRPPEKNDFTPLNELALISFPTRELFEVKLHEFDLIVFDRYFERGVLPPAYFNNISDYVEKGGAVLAAVGPDYAGPRSIYRTPMARILPGAPTERVFEEPFRAQIGGVGMRHPVSSGLLDNGGKTPEWGHWYRQVDTEVKRGEVVMTGVNDSPLLVLDRVGKGRVATFMSDHVWLWARGHENGGPHSELIRRLVHWLMKEPDLEEEDLKAQVDVDKLTVIRRSLEEQIPPVTITAPSGAQETVTLTPDGRGAATTTLTARETGLYKIEDGRRRAMAAVGELNPPELSDLRATPERLAPFIKATGGGISWISEGIPDFRRTRPDRDAAGSGWLGLTRNESYVVTGVKQLPLLPALLFLLLCAGTVMLAWWREGR